MDYTQLDSTILPRSKWIKIRPDEELEQEKFNIFFGNVRTIFFLLGLTASKPNLFMMQSKKMSMSNNTDQERCDQGTLDKEN